jgi:hypothetical protein
LAAKHVDADRSAGDAVASIPRQALAEQVGDQSGAGSLLFLVAALLAGSALISLTLLWFAIRGFQWLLLHG